MSTKTDKDFNIGDKVSIGTAIFTVCEILKDGINIKACSTWPFGDKLMYNEQEVKVGGIYFVKYSDTQSWA
jgi:hypothetical protein